jgi:2-oxoglutarate dehydrogenase E2 component (dihydrolipoamide succinyltransferase)
MATKVMMEALSPTMEEGRLVKWLKNEGDAIKSGDVLAEVETDKAVMELVARGEGVLRKRLVEEGTATPVGQLIGVIAAADENIDALVGSAGGAATGAGAPPQQQSAPAASSAPNQKPAAPTPAPRPADGARETREKMTTRRKRIAENLLQSQHMTAHLTTFNEIDMSAVSALRERLKERVEKEHGVKLSFMPFFAKATAMALKAFPTVNAQIDGDTIVYKHYVNLGIAVASEQGLVVPNIKDADRMSMVEFSRQLGAVAKRARDAKLTMDDLTGGTFTITNGGVFGSLVSTPIINYPQVGILGLHKTQDRPVAIDGKVEIRPMMYVALSYDHRIIDGQQAVLFLVRVKELMEDPAAMLVE